MSEQLTPREIGLLNRYIDGEASVLDRFFARRLVARSEAAQEYVAHVRSVGHMLKRVPTPSCKNLWSGICQRIEAEERAARYLGGRAAEPMVAQVSWGERFAWASGGAMAVAASVLVAVTLQLQQPKQMADLGSPRLVAAPLQDFTSSAPVAFVPAGSTTAAKENEALELDWVRSEGTWRVVKIPNDPHGMIWVKKRIVPRSFVEELPVTAQTRIPQGIAVARTR